MLKKILLSMGILSIGALCVYAATSGSSYVYYGTNKKKTLLSSSWCLHEDSHNLYTISISQVHFPLFHLFVLLHQSAPFP